MSQHQPGPYGMPPQQPNPYSQDGTPGQGHGFPPPPTAPPAAPYGAPPQPGPYGAPPQQPGGWGPPGMPGQYPPPVPPQGGGKGKAIGIAVAALVVVGAIVGGVVVFTGSDKSDDGSVKAGASASPGTPEDSASPSATAIARARYKLTAPDTLADDYKKDTSNPGPGFDSKALAELRVFGMTNPQGANGTYKSGEDKRAQKLLRFSGAWGDSVRSPEALVDGLFKSVADGAAKDTDPSSKFEFEGSPQRMKPDGLDGDTVMKCQMSKVSGPASSSRAIRMPLCIWADSSTVGTVFAMDTSLLVQGQDLSLDAASGRVAKFRERVRVPAQG
ncbi:hypothetical protein [Streptomyces olivoreticuli]|uniref:hypothetical protein n=1 Tax=Streptomyces olivoreticuli TaxID=68246 RepID=UPI0013C2E14B|nr:hypothetical protein [Streptomyces olivoreticuli]